MKLATERTTTGSGSFSRPRAARRRLTRVETFEPRPFTFLGWDVDDLDASVCELASRGVEFERYPSLSQDQIAIWIAPGGARVCRFESPDGNTLSVSEPTG